MHVDVIVIGAGLAGLSAVGRLRRLGVPRVLLLEARADVGGRVRMTNFAGSQFNVGPEWLHGRTNNPLCRLVSSKLNLKLRDCDNYTYFLNRPKMMSLADREKTFRKKVQDIEEEIDTRLMTCDSDRLQGKSVSEVVGFQKAEHESDLEKLATYWAFNFENGSSVTDYSALVYKMSSKIFENVPPAAAFYFESRSGFSKVVEYFSNRAEISGTNTVFNDPVRLINCQEDRVFISTQKNETYTSDFCILTAPISVIQRNQITISPPIDKDFQKAIQTVFFSDYTRVFVECNHNMRLPSFDWFMDADFDRDTDIPVWQNPRSATPILIAHLCEKPQVSKIHEKVERSLKRIFGEEFKGILNVKVLSLADCRYSFGAFPCASADFNRQDALAFERIGEDSRLQFAGDGYSLEYFGTVQGAVFSAAKAVERIRHYLACGSNHASYPYKL